MIEDLLMMDVYGVIALVAAYLSIGLFYDASYESFKANKPTSKWVMDSELLGNKGQWVRRQRLKLILFAALILLAQIVGLSFAWLLKLEF